jgi:dihydrofolate reductase
MRPPVVFVAAVADNGVIGRENRLIWRLKSDLKHYRSLTLGRPVIMGRRTFASIGKALPGRETIVVTRDRGFSAPGAFVAHGVEEALRLAGERADALGADSIPVAGGGEIYRQMMEYADRLAMTFVRVSPQGDVRFPEIDPAVWRDVYREPHPAGPDDEFAFDFVDYIRR